MDKTLLAVEHAPSDPGPRYGYGKPPNARLLEILARDDDTFRRNLEMVFGYHDDLLRIAVRPVREDEPAWLNRWLLGMDTAVLYGFLRSRRPLSFVEIGSGMSTLVARRAVTDGGLPTSITSIDPHPREAVESACDRALRTPLETTELGLFRGLQAGDMVFMDGSHHVFTNSDATVFFLEVLPELPSGVLVGMHDILLPDDYLPSWTGYHWSEQYLMAAYLLAEGDRIQLELACSYVTEHSDLHHILDPLWVTPSLEGLDRRGFGFWFTTVNR